MVAKKLLDRTDDQAVALDASHEASTAPNHVGNDQKDAKEHANAKEPIKIIHVLARDLDVHAEESTQLKSSQYRYQRGLVMYLRRSLE
jgi:hypothetical protein